MYALTIAKSGSKLHAAKEGSCVPMDLDHPPARDPAGQTGPPPCGSAAMSFNGSIATANGRVMTLAEFAGRVLNGVDRPVIDKTGLTGLFDFHLEYEYVPLNAAGPALLNGVASPVGSAPQPDGGGPSIFTALQEQLGLKLSPEKGSVEVLVIDSIERPAEN